ncbi:MAG: PAS domain-containing protein, partial [Paracoccaceae bacterium]
MAGLAAMMAGDADSKHHETDLRARADAAEAAREQLAEAIETMEDGFALFDADDVLILCNQRYREFYAETAPVLIPGTSFETIERYAVAHGQLPDACGREGEWLEKRLKGRRNDRTRLLHRLADGRILRVIERRTRSGGLIGIHSDVTALKDGKRRLDNIITGADVGTWEWSVASGEQYVNDRWLDMIGFSREELEPITIDTWADLVHPDDRAVIEPNIRTTLAGETEAFEGVFRMRHKHGHWVWVQTRGRVFRRAQDGSPEVMSGVHIDVTSQKRDEER